MMNEDHDPSIAGRAGQYHYLQSQQLAQQAYERQAHGPQTEPIGIPARNGAGEGYIRLPQLQTTLRHPLSGSATSSFFSPTSASRLAPHTNEPSSVASSYKSAAPYDERHSVESTGAFPPSSFPSDHSHSMPIQPRTSLLTSKLSAAGDEFQFPPHRAMTLPDPLARRPSTSFGSYSSDPRHFSTSQPSSVQSQRFVPEPESPAGTPEAVPGAAEHLDIANHPVADVIVMLTALLQKIVQTNDAIQPQYPSEDPEDAFAATVLAFHGRNVPAISLHAYLSRILKYCPTTNEVFISLLVYFDRIAQRASRNGAPLFVMDSYNIHRLIIAAVTVASKFFSDVFYKNSRYAKVGGLPVDELNHLELQFLLLTDFRLMVSVEELQRYGDLLLRFWQKEQG